MSKKLLYSALLFWGMLITLHAEKISNYTIDINVAQSGELSIVEHIEYDFEGVQKHGIFRDIPYTIKVDGRIIDLELYAFSVQMDDAIVTWEESTLRSTQAGDTIRLKIGSASTYVTGKHSYQITYRVKKGVLPAVQNEAYDAIRWNMIGTGWKIPLSNIEANIFLPHSLDQQNIAVSTYTGTYGTKSSQAQSQWISNKHLQVKIARLKPYDGATVELAYPGGLLEQTGKENIEATFYDWFWANWHWGALLGFLLYFRDMYKKHTGYIDHRSVAVQYYPPKGMSILEVGLVLDKFADNKDFSAAVLELAHLGFLEITQAGENSDPILKATGKRSQTLSMDQSYLLNQILFRGGKNTFSFTKGSKSKADALQKGFKHINENLYKWVVSDGHMVKNPQKIRNTFLKKSLLYLLPVLALTFYGYYLKYGSDIMLMVFPLAFGGAGLSVFLKSQDIGGKIFGYVFMVIGFFPLLGLIDKGMGVKELLTGPFSVLFILLIALFYIYRKIGKFTQKGAYTRKHLLGLKEFISRVKEDEIQRRLKEDPLYLESLLPYAVLFGESKHWLSFFALLSVETPLWYHGNINHINNFSSSVDKAATPPSQSSGGSGYSGGGGFSGGGGGGGGGGSW